MTKKSNQLHNNAEDEPTVKVSPNCALIAAAPISPLALSWLKVGGISLAE
jgi:hypothetical protein